MKIFNEQREFDVSLNDLKKEIEKNQDLSAWIISKNGKVSCAYNHTYQDHVSLAASWLHKDGISFKDNAEIYPYVFKQLKGCRLGVYTKFDTLFFETTPDMDESLKKFIFEIVENWNDKIQFVLQKFSNGWPRDIFYSEDKEAILKHLVPSYQPKYVSPLKAFREMCESLMRRDAYVFDVDETLLRTNAKIRIIGKDGEVIKSITPKEFSNYVLKSGESYDEHKSFIEFDQIDIPTSRPINYTGKIFKSVYNGAKNRGDEPEVYILTARKNVVKNDIQAALKHFFGIELPLDKILCVGDISRKMGGAAEAKKHVLSQMRSKFKKITLFDDDAHNIKKAEELTDVKGRHIDI